MHSYVEKMAVVHVFVTFHLLCHHVLLTVAVTKVTNLTFFRQRLTWNDAKDACHHFGGYLVEIHDEAKNNAVIHLLHEFLVGQPLHVNMATGLTKRNTPGEFLWAESCKPSAPTHWALGAYPGDNPWLKCGKITRKTNSWSWGKCEHERFFMCEKTSDDQCPYETHSQTTLLEDGVSLQSTNHSVPLSECFDLCDVMTSLDDQECWAFSFNSELCTLFFTADPYLVANLTYQYHDTKCTLFLKHCYYGSLGEKYTLNDEMNLSPVPEINCTRTPIKTTDDMPTKVTITPTDETIMLTEDSTMPTESKTTSIVDSTNSREATTMPIDMSTSAKDTTSTGGTKLAREDRTEGTTSTFSVTSHATQRTLPNKYFSTTSAYVTSTFALTDATDSRIFYRESTPAHSPGLTLAPGASYQTTTSDRERPTTELISISASSLGLTGTATTASREYGRTSVTYSTTKKSPQDLSSVCYCPCREQRSAEEKHRLLQELLTNLTINKTQLSSFRRKYYSVMDFRPLSTGMGCTGIAFVAFALILILSCDVTTALSR